MNALPFGRHRGRDLSGVPTDYLRWCISTCRLSPSLRAALAAELAGRGIDVPEPTPPRIPACPRCPGASYRCTWQTDRLARRHVRASCAGCGMFLAFAPVMEPFSSLADGATGGQA
jgi:hypothetical protein